MKLPEGADASHARLAELLAPGEVVLWVGSPAPDRYAKQMQRLWTIDSSCLSRIVAFALVAVLGAPVFLAEGAINRLPSPFNWVVVVVGLGALLGAVALAWHLGVRYLATERAVNTTYAITHTRVIESRPGKMRTYWPADLEFLTVRRVSNGVGDVLFTVEIVPVDEAEPNTVEHGLIGVEHPHDVAKILRAAFPYAFVNHIRRPNSTP